MTKASTSLIQNSGAGAALRPGWSLAAGPSTLSCPVMTQAAPGGFWATHQCPLCSPAAQLPTALLLHLPPWLSSELLFALSLKVLQLWAFPASALPSSGFPGPFFEQESRPRLPGDTVLLLQPAYPKVPGQSYWQHKGRSSDVCREQGLICCPFPPDLDPTCLCTLQDLCVAQGAQTGCRDSSWQEEQHLGQLDRWGALQRSETPPNTREHLPLPGLMLKL